MKRYNHLWSKIIEFENILTAARQAQRGKRFRENVLDFNYNLETELIQLKKELETKTYQPGEYRTFEIVEPKRRLISAAPYRDRVVHHALCNIIVPIFDRTFFLCAKSAKKTGWVFYSPRFVIEKPGFWGVKLVLSFSLHPSGVSAITMPISAIAGAL
jgi:hypothetical protein